MSKLQDDFERDYLISRNRNPNETFYIKSRRKKNGYNCQTLDPLFQEYLKTGKVAEHGLMQSPGKRPGR